MKSMRAPGIGSQTYSKFSQKNFRRMDLNASPKDFCAKRVLKRCALPDVLEMAELTALVFSEMVYSQRLFFFSVNGNLVRLARV